MTLRVITPASYNWPTSVMSQFHKHFLCLLCRDNLIQAIGVDAEGKLVSMSGLMETSNPEQRDSGSDNDGGEN